MKNNSVKSVVVLTVICLIVTALLAVTNSITAPIIEKARHDKAVRSLNAVLPYAGGFKEVPLPEDAPESVKAAYLGNDGSCAFLLTTRSQYSSGDMGITLGLNPDGSIEGIALTSYQESKDFGRETYPGNYVGKTSADYTEVDSFAGVTYSSKALQKAIGDAFTCFKLIGGGAVE